MMPGKSSLIFICLMFTLLACKKESTRQPVFQNHSPHLSYPFIKSISSTYDPTVTYYYDTLGRVLGYGNNSYTYTTDSVYWNGHALCALNSAGLATFCLANANIIYGYDSSGHLVSSVLPGANSDSALYQNNNLIAVISRGDTESGQVKYDVTFYSYNSHICTVGNFNYGRAYLGKTSLNLVDSVISVEGYGPPGLSISNFYDEPQNYVINRVTYTYIYNSLGYVASCATVNTSYEGGVQSNQTISTSNYSYY
jgi:hypothetical protein